MKNAIFEIVTEVASHKSASRALKITKSNKNLPLTKAGRTLGRKGISSVSSYSSETAIDEHFIC